MAPGSYNQCQTYDSGAGVFPWCPILKRTRHDMVLHRQEHRTMLSNVHPASEVSGAECHTQWYITLLTIRKTIPASYMKYVFTLV